MSFLLYLILTKGEKLTGMKNRHSQLRASDPPDSVFSERNDYANEAPVLLQRIIGNPLIG